MIAYILKSSLSLIILFGLYWFLLRKEKLFEFNRFFLVLSVVLSLLVPFISIPVNFKTTPGQENFIPAYVPEINTTYNIVPDGENNIQSYIEKQPLAIHITAILFILYISGVIMFLVRFLRNIYIIYRRTKSSEKTSFKGYRIVLTNDMTDPCCFFSSIYLNRDDYLTGRIDKELLDHELEHARQSHTIDILLIELVKIFYWFNPVHLLYDRAIRINHEYLADNGVISDKSDIICYADKLLSFITCRNNMSLTSGSNHSFTKMRLTMMMKPGSGRFRYGTRIALTLCMGSFVFLLLSFKETAEQPSLSDLSENVPELIQGTIRGIVTTDDGKPLFGATIIFTCTDNISVKAIADSDGRFTANDVQPGTSIRIECRGFKGQTLKADFSSEMAVKLSRDPDFKGIIAIPIIQEVRFRNSDFTPAKAIIVIDRVITDYSGRLKVSPGEIKSLSALKDKEATDKYGDKAKDGAIEIILFGNKTGRKQYERSGPDSSRYLTHLSINHVANKGELIDIPVSNLQNISVWNYYDIDKINKKELRFIGIMTRDFYKVKGKVIRENGKPLSGVRISSTDNPVTETSGKDGRFEMEDIKPHAMMEFALPGYKNYYLATGEVIYTIDLTIELEKDGKREKDDVYVTAEKMPQYPGGEMELRKFIATNLNYPEEARVQKAEGVVIVRFVVNTKGNIEDVRILQKVHPAIDTEVLRIVSKLERFTPGSQGGKLVNVYYTLPVTFALPKTNTAK